MKKLPGHHSLRTPNPSQSSSTYRVSVQQQLGSGTPPCTLSSGVSVGIKYRLSLKCEPAGSSQQALGRFCFCPKYTWKLAPRGKSWAFILLVAWHRITPDVPGTWLKKKKSKHILKIPARLWTIVTMTLIEDNVNLALTNCSDYHWNNSLLPTQPYLTHTSSWGGIALYLTRKQTLSSLIHSFLPIVSWKTG